MSWIGKQIRFCQRFTFAFWRKQKFIILISAFVSLSAFFLIPRAIALLGLNPTRNIGLVGKFTPSELPLEIQGLVSQGLTSLDNQNYPQPGIANNWEANSNHREYIFTLKDDLFWDDGKRVKSADIVYDFEDVTVQALDDQKLKFSLKETFTPLPAVVSRPIFKKGLVGIGGYKIKKIKENNGIIEKMVLSPKITFKFYPSEKAVKTAFKLGQINELWHISNIDDLEQWNNLKIEPEVNYQKFVAIFFDTQLPKFSEKQIRQALAYSIKDRWEPKALGSVSPKSWAFNKNVKPYNHDLANARKLLKEIGSEAVPQEIELSTIPSLLPSAEAIKKDWEALGIKTKIKIIQTLDEGFEALLVTQEIPPDPDQYVLWHSTQPVNISNYRSPKVDKLLEDGRKQEDKEERKQIYFDFQKTLSEDLPAIFLYHPTSYKVTKSSTKFAL